MIECPTCRAENKDDAKFCFSCGTALVTKVPETPAVPPPTVPPSPPPPWTYWRERERHADLLGLVGLALFLIIVSLLFAANPNLIADVSLWSERVSRSGIWTRPPEGVITSAALFFGLIGASSFLVAGLRVVVGRARFRALADILAGTAAIAFAYLLTFYADRRITGQLVLALEGAVVGALILVYIGIGLIWTLGRRVPRPEAQRPLSRP